MTASATRTAHTVRSTAARAAAVSRTLRAAGFNPLGSGTPRSRQGVRVQSSVLGQVTVSVDIDAPGRRRRMAQDAMEALTAAGYQLTELRWEDGFEGFAHFSALPRTTTPAPQAYAAVNADTAAALEATAAEAASTPLVTIGAYGTPAPTQYDTTMAAARARVAAEIEAAGGRDAWLAQKAAAQAAANARRAEEVAELARQNEARRANQAHQGRLLAAAATARLWGLRAGDWEFRGAYATPAEAHAAAEALRAAGTGATVYRPGCGHGWDDLLTAPDSPCRECHREGVRARLRAGHVDEAALRVSGVAPQPAPAARTGQPVVVARNANRGPLALRLRKVDSGLYDTSDGRYGVVRLDSVGEWDTVRTEGWGIADGGAQEGELRPTVYRTMREAVAALDAELPADSPARGRRACATCGGTGWVRPDGTAYKNALAASSARRRTVSQAAQARNCPACHGGW